MRIHTNTLTHDNLETAARTARVTLRTASGHGSRSRDHAFNVRLEGSGGRNNTGLYGAGDYSGATWDEWGAFLAALYAVDPDATIPGVYESAAHFHWATGDRFRTPGLPANTHKRHRWEREETAVTGTYNTQRCAKCGALSRRATSPEALATILEG